MQDCRSTPSPVRTFRLGHGTYETWRFNLANTYAYEPFGKIRATTGSVANPWRFTGAYFDSETRLSKMGARYYDPALGVWTQIDPVQYARSCVPAPLGIPIRTRVPTQ
jgi:RHS repeat-associated protein